MFPLLTPPALVAPLQEINRSGNWQVGDQVELWHNWSGQFRWMIGKIEKIEGGKYYVRFGTGKYNVDWFAEERLRNEAKEKALTEGRARTLAILKAGQNYRSSLETLAWLSEPERWPCAFRPALDNPQAIATLRTQSDSLAEIYTKLGPATQPRPNGVANFVWDHPEVWGPILEKRQALVQQAAKTGAESRAKWNLDRLRTETQNLEKNEGWMQGTEYGWQIMAGYRADAKSKIQNLAQEILKAGGGSETAELSEFDTLADALVAQATKLAPQLPAKNTHPDAALAAKLTALWKKSHPTSTLVRIAFSTPDWYIRKNNLGIILGRERYGAAFYRKPGCPYLIEETLSWNQDYAGAGKYVDAPFVHSPAFRFHK